MFTSYNFNYVLGRKAMCMCCGEPVVNGMEFARVSTSKAHKFAHKKCLTKMWKEGTAYELTNGCNYDSQLENHDLVIVAPKEETPYFAECGFVVYPHNAQYRKFILPNETCGYRDGHIVKRVLENTDYKVFVNGKEVFSHDEYRRVLGK